ncbi:MAG: hypothetical protein ACFN02_01445 [Olsenella profusa]
MDDAVPRRSLLAALPLALLALAGCRSPEGYGPRSTMSDEEASSACLDEVSRLIADSDADGLVAAFSEAAREQDAGLSSSDAEELMDILGGGTLADGDFWSSSRVYPSGYNLVISTATVTAPDGTRWQVHVTDCTLNRDDPSKVGLRTVEVIPNSVLEAPRGFSWYGTDDDRWPTGIRLIRSWDGWDPHTSPYSPDW